MPRRRIAKRRNRRRKKKSVANMTVMSRFPFPTTYRCKMRWNRYQDLDAPAGGISTTYVSANGAYDPASLGAGATQPLGWDNLAALYDHYTVLGSKITVKFIKSTDTDTDVDLSQVGLFINDDTTLSATTGLELLQRPDVKNAVLFPEDGSKTLVKYFSAKKYFARNPRDSDVLTALNNANPSEEAYFFAFQCPMDKAGTVNPALIRLYIEVDYIIEWSEPRDIAKSTI